MNIRRHCRNYIAVFQHLLTFHTYWVTNYHPHHNQYGKKNLLSVSSTLCRHLSVMSSQTASMAARWLICICVWPSYTFHLHAEKFLSGIQEWGVEWEELPSNVREMEIDIVPHIVTHMLESDLKSDPSIVHTFTFSRESQDSPRSNSINSFVLDKIYPILTVQCKCIQLCYIQPSTILHVKMNKSRGGHSTESHSNIYIHQHAINNW